MKNLDKIKTFISESKQGTIFTTPKVIKSILQKLNSRGFNLNEKGQIPRQLNFSTGIKVSEPDYELLRKEIRKNEKS